MSRFLDKEKRIALIAVLICAIVLCSSFFAEATVVGANKGVMNFRNVLKNGYAQEFVTLTTDTDFNLSVTYKVEGELAEWVRLEPSTQPFFISRDRPYVVAVVVEPPNDVRNQHYDGSVRFVTGALAGPEGQFGTAVRAAINARIGVDITGQEIVSCNVVGFELNDIEEDYPIEFYAVVSNNGNVRIKPSFILEFWNQDQTELIETFNFTLNRSILPTVQERVFYSIDQDLEIGQYWVKVRTPFCGEGVSAFLTMSVIERGGVSDKGELVNIENAAWAKAGDIVPIDAVFRNLGSRVVSAKFKGTISSGEEIFKIIDTDPLDVMPGETVRLKTYFNPTQDGQYIITGRVLYNKKLTFDRSSILNVNPSGMPPGADKAFSWSIILIILVVIIIVLVLLVLKKRKQLIKGTRHNRF